MDQKTTNLKQRFEIHTKRIKHSEKAEKISHEKTEDDEVFCA